MQGILQLLLRRLGSVWVSDCAGTHSINGDRPPAKMFRTLCRFPLGRTTISWRRGNRPAQRL